MLRVNEIFYSLQGEGARAGEPSVFVRLSGCSVQHACYASGVRCDTEFESGREYEIEELLSFIETSFPRATWIVWTGGEPADQLTAENLEQFRMAGYMQAIETSGIHDIHDSGCWDELDYVVVSPKVGEHVLRKNFGSLVVDELRYVRAVGQSIPEPSIAAEHYYISPHCDGNQINVENLNHCIQLCLDNPQWRLSVQQHKLWGVR